ncbi:MAG: exonuclease domain-containing protein [Thermomicrobiales bacterium]|nr:exonuclease domain-containing protein [Thermomicrobiales bacterium]MCO5227990.1 exonuclease domain-containing protein [Thermomicrobiales bacterium]
MESTQQNTEEIQRYTALCDRAVAFVEERGGAVPEDILIDYVFGSVGSPAIWRPLLRDVLQTDERVSFRANGEWFIPAENIRGASDQLLLTEFVAIDVETTGLQASRHKIIEVALLRYRDGVLQRRYESLLNPGRTIPAFITKLTTIKNEDVAEAPVFEDIAQDVLEFVGEDILVGHNIGFDIGFLNAELDRVGKPKLVNDRIDTMGLATRLLREIRKPSLDRVASQVGLNPRGIHRAGGDAKLTAEVAMRLMGEAASQGIGNVDRLKSIAFVPEHRVRDDVGRARAVMDRSLAHGLPKKPGVYIMKDARGEIIYVGKAKNLRNRVSSYYSQPIGMTRKMDGLIESVARIDHHIVGSELEALLLESQLIHRYMPRYNTALKKSEHYPFIKVDTASAWPRVSVVRNRKEDGATYFGPYTSANNARRTVDVINSALPLRTCTRSFKNAKSYGQPCIALDLHQCLGPCTGKIERDTYQVHVNAVLDLLEGRDDAIYLQLQQQLEESAEKLDFERADRIRRNILNLTSILGEQQRTRDADALLTLALVLPGPETSQRDIWLVLHGRIWARFLLDLAQEEAETDLVERISRSLERARAYVPPPRSTYEVDEAGLLTRFLFRNEGSAAMVMLSTDEEGQVADSAMDIVERVLAVTNDQIAELDVNRKLADGNAIHASEVIGDE